ncbi:MAG: HEAT repeat domain-containing protein [Bacillota bacterium]
MGNYIDRFCEQEARSLIDELLNEKERHRQEKLVQRIAGMKDERTAALVAGLLHSQDPFIRNTAIELLASLGEKALDAIKSKLSDSDRNIRKFALDALKHIRGRHSCELAAAALDDEDQNVVEAALEVIAQQQYKEAAGRLLETLKKTDSVWVVNALLRTFASLDATDFADAAGEKVFSVNASAIERNILVNTYVRALGRIGSHRDVDAITGRYMKDFAIEDSNLVFALSSLVLKADMRELSPETAAMLGRVLKERWDCRDTGQILLCIGALVKLQLDFFLDDIEEIHALNRNEEFFTEKLYELLQRLENIPASFISRMLGCMEPELVLTGLKLIHAKKLEGFNAAVEELCKSEDRDVSRWALRIVSELEAYKNGTLLESLTDCSEEAGVAYVESISAAGAVESLLPRLEHKSPKVRDAAARKLLSIIDRLNTGLLEEILNRNPGHEGAEALEVLFRLDEGAGWRHMAPRMRCMDENARARLVDIARRSETNAFYEFMATMSNDPSPKVRKKTIKALNGKIGEKSLHLLKKLYENECDPINKMEIITNIYRFSSYNTMDIIEDAVNCGNVLARMAAVRALGLMSGSRAEGLLKTLLEDRVDEVREAAEEAMRKKGVAE